MQVLPFNNNTLVSSLSSSGTSHQLHGQHNQGDHHQHHTSESHEGNDTASSHHPHINDSEINSGETQRTPQEPLHHNLATSGLHNHQPSNGSSNSQNIQR